MAELEKAIIGHKTGQQYIKGKKRNTRIDLTPMVDLGFLLISFFIFTTSISRPTLMKLWLPKNAGKNDSQLLARSYALTILLGNKNQLFYYESDDPAKSIRSDYINIRNIILDKKRRTDPAHFEIILKPSSDASYKNTVDALDEMTIDAIRHYVLTDISPVEYRIIRSIGQ